MILDNDEMMPIVLTASLAEEGIIYCENEPYLQTGAVDHIEIEQVTTDIIPLCSLDFSQLS